MKQNIVELKGVGKVYARGTQSVTALKGVNLAIEPGEFMAVVGPSGSGKTTLLNLVACLDVPSSGTLEFQGQVLGEKSEDQLAVYRRTRLGFVFQSYNLIPVLSIEENVEIPLLIGKRFSRRLAREKARAMLARVGLADMGRRFPRELSGGQEQRVAIARALVHEPVLVLADEPTANLDSKTAVEVLQIMESLNRDQGVTFVFSTHDPQVRERARRVVTIHDGEIVSDGPSS